MVKKESMVSGIHRTADEIRAKAARNEGLRVWDCMNDSMPYIARVRALSFSHFIESNKHTRVMSSGLFSVSCLIRRYSAGLAFGDNCHTVAGGNTAQQSGIENVAQLRFCDLLSYRGVREYGPIIDFPVPSLG